MGSRQRRAGRGVAAMALAVLALTLSGCGDFFVCQKASCTNSGSSSSSTVDYAYISNSSSGATYINGYSVSSGTLTATTSSPYSVGFTPTAMAASSNNSFLYVGSNLNVSSGSEAIYRFNIGTGGALTNGSSIITAYNIAAMTVSPDGNWLIVLTASDPINLVSPQIVVFAINNTTGALSFKNSAAFLPQNNTAVVTPQAIAIAPSGQYIAIAMGTAGFATYSFDTSTTSSTSGAIGGENLAYFTSTGIGAYDLAIDTNNYLYVATTGNLQAYAVTSKFVAVSPAASTKATSSASGPYSVIVDGTGYVFAGAGNNSIFGYGNAGSGVLNALSPASTTGPATLTKMAIDSTGKYLVALGFSSSSGATMYSISATGVLTQTSTVPTSATNAVPAAIAFTH